ncbi:DUF2855 family protein [Allohahella marinimesophila]|uniref:DUF2855 family protein n=1 Tax=Allohahella marinimesophila TaxID=1054972 RepID=A0ABP7NVY1_9GAMM
MAQFQIDKGRFISSRIVSTDPAAEAESLQDGDILVAIDRFAFTANNVTYAVAGDQLGYWTFFPPVPSQSNEDVSGWGVIPVWGFADVIASKSEDIDVGERLFGYFPPANTLRITPVRVAATRLIDGAPHRSELPPAYNSYSRVSNETGYDSALDNQRMLLWPLHITSYCLWDMLQEQGWFGAKQVVILSASSKTSTGLAYALEADESAPDVIAITSQRNLHFVEGLGLYSKCLTYDELAHVDASVPTVIVDMSGSGQALGQLHTQLADNMKQCINVGLTHWDEVVPGKGIIKSRSQFFFAPSHIQKRIKDWGADGFAERLAGFLRNTAEKSSQWLKLSTVAGLSGLADVYPKVCEGMIAPDEGLIVVLEDDT